MREQTIRLSPRVTAFTAVCEECVDDAREWADARVEGTLREERVHGTAVCARGHVILVERAVAPAAR